tara:strand:+ start:1220 stop:2011 length:792 start_codon:yes stop_codon:yes gene_type:complete
MLNNKTPWTDGLYCFEEWITDHDLKHWCFGGDGDGDGSGDDGFNDELNNVDVVDMQAEEDAFQKGLDEDAENLATIQNLAYAQQNDLLGPNSNFNHMFQNVNALGPHTVETNLAKGNTLDSVDLSLQEAQHSQNDVGSMLANIIGITSPIGINEQGMFQEETGFSPGNALGAMASVLGGPIGLAANMVGAGYAAKDFGKGFSGQTNQSGSVVGTGSQQGIAQQAGNSIANTLSNLSDNMKGPIVTTSGHSVDPNGGPNVGVLY